MSRACQEAKTPCEYVPRVPQKLFRYIVLRVLVCLLLALGLSGCGGLYQEEYVYSAPYTDTVQDASDAQGEEIFNYAQLSGVLTDMVYSAQESGKLRFNHYSGSVGEDLAAICYEIKTQDPMGAYAVEDLSYDLRRIVSYYVSDVSIRYKRSAEEIAQVETVNGISGLGDYLELAVESHAQRKVARIYSSVVNEAFIRQQVHQAYLDHPLSCAQEPVVRVTAYPSDGIHHIYDISLYYGMEEPDYESLRDSADTLISNACIALQSTDTGGRALECAQFLYSHCVLQEDGDGNTAFDALLQGGADCEGLALAYKALCDRAGVDALVVEGTLGTLGAQSHFWNLIAVDGDYYHVDLSRVGEVGWAGAFLLDDDMAWGTYLWDADVLPACSGPLRYADFAGAIDGAPVPEAEIDSEITEPETDGETPDSEISDLDLEPEEI